MKFLKLLIVILLLTALGGFVYVSLIDVTVQQEIVTETIPTPDSQSNNDNQ